MRSFWACLTRDASVDRYRRDWTQRFASKRKAQEGGPHMFRESDDAVGALLKSRVLGQAGQIDDPVRVSSWWADHGIAIDSAELDREALFALATRCRESKALDWVAFLWHVLAWGVMGDYRNAPTIVGSAAGPEQHDRLNDILCAAAESSHRGEIGAAYKAIRGKVPRLGPAFFSKFLYFTSDRN